MGLIVTTCTSDTHAHFPQVRPIMGTGVGQHLNTHNMTPQGSRVGAQALECNYIFFQATTFRLHYSYCQWHGLINKLLVSDIWIHMLPRQRLVAM
jgi:hypothetical protein